jgi:hypothetical protein
MPRSSSTTGKRHANQFGARASFRRSERLMEDRFVDQVLRLGKDAAVFAERDHFHLADLLIAVDFEP